MQEQSFVEPISNYDINSYRFQDLDLKMAVDGLKPRDKKILVLHLMGHKQREIAAVCDVSRSMISKRINSIIKILRNRLDQN
ncbi:hypothetical protein GF312_03685 [Candidatus Poribacteria bacterium]|nr:hypothetical protein [Candidatus Poribacteria bacterium]